MTHYPRAAMLPAWLLDFVNDPRVAHNVPRTLRRVARDARLIDRAALERALATRPPLLISFDVERDPAEGFESSRSRTAATFLEAFRARARASAVRAAFFVQGEMVEALAAPLRDLAADGHLIGLHGYRHELWGEANWVTRRAAITVAERERRLKLSLAAFDRAALPRPTAFRAPNFTIDAATYALLYRHGFRVDSSAPSQRGTRFTTFDRNGVRVIPVTCAPLPRRHRHATLGVVTAVHYHHFNFDVCVRASDDAFDALLEQSLAFQAAVRARPYALAYAHNWEFAADPDGLVDRLVTRYERAAARYGARLGRLDELAAAPAATTGGTT